MRPLGRVFCSWFLHCLKCAQRVAITEIKFKDRDRAEWLRTIISFGCSLPGSDEDDIVRLKFDNQLSPDTIDSAHFVVLACFIESLDRKGYMISLDRTSPLGEYLWDTLKFRDYWAGHQNYVAAKENSIFNLWRVVDEEKEVHSQCIHDYLKQRRFFQRKDLSAVKSSLDEVYYNIFDHAEAEGNAFSLIKFDRHTQKLYVAVCDFGKGVAKKIRDKFPEIADDAAAIRKAMEYKFTIGSQQHNMGMGLDNILMTCRENDTLQIISNNGFINAKRDHIQAGLNTFSLDGTLIFYELSLSHFEDMEIIDNFDLDF